MVEFTEVLLEERLPRTAVVDLTAADLIVLPARPAILLPAPGENAILQVISAGALLRAGSVPSLGIVRINIAGIAITEDIDLGKTENTLFFRPPVMSGAYPLSQIANQPVILSAVTGRITGGDAALRINLLYRMLWL